ncbi:protein kinase [Cystobacter fuscus]|uniref:Protein kinase n=1 Tax=Cystobacter fuscus TaxID=43 RepID=A0A250J4I8_9BACT|nr:AAA family ATPase [Cystobacter fuscus]ATB38440.1 protein kinase [Cystobacter fuscus]
MTSRNTGWHDLEEGASDFSDTLLLKLRESPALLRLPWPGELLGGQRGDRFELRERLGQGGMGQVFLAWDRELRRHVALKFIQPLTNISGPTLGSLLEEEARAIARLDHDNIIRLFDISEWRPTPSAVVPFLIMECLKGKSLSARLRQGALDWNEALAVFHDVLAGLEHAHAHQVIHRDLKPGNVFVLDEGRTKLLDFGLARLALNPGSTTTRGLLRVGSPPYMAPEQWLDTPHDARTDLWAAGLLFYLMLTGKHPCPSHSAEDLRDWALGCRPLPSVRDGHPELPAEMDALLGKATAREPEQRFQSSHEFSEELTALARRREAARKGPPAPRRAQVTFVCCVMERPPEPLDDETLGERQDDFQRTCSELLQRQGGTVLQCMGDEVLACFGHPRAEEDALLHAVRAGLALASMPRARFAVRVGLHTASVVLRPLPPAGQSGSASALQGDAHVLAIQVARQAQAGTALLSQSTHQGLRGAFITEPLARGDAGAVPIPLHRLVREREEPLRFERTRPPGLTPLVGRDEELHQLREHWEQARRGHGALVLIQGEAGIGKSRLLSELREQVGSEAGTRAVAQCWQESSSSPFFPISQLLRQLFALPPEAPLEQRRARVIQRLEELGIPHEEYLPLLESLLRLSGSEASLAEGAKLRQAQLLEQLVTLLLALTGSRSPTTRPALLIIEDLHWADPSTLDLLACLSERVRSAPLWVLLSARPELRPPWPPTPGVHRLVLPRLSLEHTMHLVARMTPGHRFSEEKLRQLQEKTDGIPLFIEELAHLLLSEGSPSQHLVDAPAIPIPLQSLLQARLDSLPGELRDLARRCAVIGRGFRPSLLAACVEQRNEELRQGLEGLVAAGLLRRCEDAPEARYEFRHALLREQARESLPRAERRLVHQRIARHLAARLADPSEFPPEWVAHHFTQAEEWAQAYPWWWEAGRTAMARRGYTEAVHHYQQARHALARLPPEPGHAAEELRLLLELGVPMLVTRCATDEVKGLFLRAEELCLQSGATEQLSPALIGQLIWHLEHADYVEAFGTAKRLMDVGERSHQQEEQAMGFVAMGICLMFQGMPRRALAHFERARELQGPGFHPERERALCQKSCFSPRVMALIFSAVVRLFLEGPRPEARNDCEQALGHLDTLHCPMTASVTLTYASLFFQQCGEVERTLELTSRLLPMMTHYNLSICGVEIAEALHGWALDKQGEASGLRSRIEQWAASGMRKGLSYCFGLLADLHLGRGEIQPGLEAVREALVWAEALGERFYEAELHHLKGQLLWHRGAGGAARLSVRKAMELARSQQAAFFERRVAETLEHLRMD